MPDQEWCPEAYPNALKRGEVWECEPQPQGEPSDAQVEALVDAAMSVAPEPFKTWRYRMTAALRASGGVR